MAKSSPTIALIPGEISWEIWTQGATGLQLAPQDATPAQRPSEIEKLPAGDLILFFPAKALTALPLQVHTADASLFPDLAATHSERLGLRPDPFAGQLVDIFPILVNSEKSTLLSIVLRTPQTEDLPKKSPKAFDISPRAFPIKGNALTLWRELGSWVFALHQQGKLLYCQATSISSPSPDAALIREIRIAIAQLSMQGIEAAPAKAIVWSSDPETQTILLSQSLSLQTDLAARPAPILPDPLSKLLPADVRAARRAARKRQNIIAVSAAIVFLFLGTIGYLGYQLWQTHSLTEKLIARSNAAAPEGEAYALHISKWDELQNGIDLNQNTVDILSRVARSIPPNSGLRLRTADISANEIRLIGEAPQPQAVNQFSKNLAQNNDLATFTWQTPEPKQSTRGWEFTFSASTVTVTP
ncbi:MAG: hypothetical protein H7Y36_07075 [Armatimonadetes bacterium]|nr:hypothetical protein [Akkermansiaceae bacterium]